MHSSIPFESLSSISAIEQRDWREYVTAKSSYEVLQSAAQSHPERAAIEFVETVEPLAEVQTLSYQQLFERVTQSANLFHSLGIAKTDVVSVVLLNFLEAHEVIWGAEATGIVNPINPFLEPETVAEIMRHAHTKVLVTQPPIHGLDIWDALLEQADTCSDLEAIVVVEAPQSLRVSDTPLPSETPGGKPIILFQQQAAKQDGARLVSNRVFQEDDLASLFHTGGTTGTPKLAPHTHLNEIFTCAMLKSTVYSIPKERVLVALPMFHVNAVIGTGIAAFAAGLTVLLLTPFGFRTPGTIPKFWEIVDRYRPNIMSAVPTIYGALTSIPKEGADTSSIRTVLCGAAPLSPEQFRKFEDYSGLQLTEGYGLTESTITATMNPIFGEKKIGSIGVRMPWTEVKIAQLDGQKIHRECGVDEVGTVVIRGKHVFPGYLGETNSGILEGGWLDTGDLGRLDADGFFWLTGREKDLIIRGGHNIDASVIENALAKHDSVEAVAAIGQPDSYAGELPIAFVQLKPGHETSAEELLTFAKANISERAASPVYIECVEAMPVTAVGKIFKPTLRISATERVLAMALEEANVSAKITVEQDKRRGLIAKVQTQDESAAREVLGRFTVLFDFV